jgi:3-isopropylmalate/(R)-2-methylmalate dehydratase small subunit
MEKFTVLHAVAAPLPLMNVDTDTIIPARYLKTIKRKGLGAAAFSALRYDEAGSERPDFVLNQDRYRGAQILIAGANFGCGSSREHAPWSLLDLGIRCVIAPSFADIFHTNCLKNGILCVALPQAQVDALTALVSNGNTAGGAVTVDLEQQQIIAPDGTVMGFAVEPARRSDLLNGLDEIGRTLTHESAITAYEAALTAPDRPVI